MGKMIGIDLGTTNSLVAVWENGKSTLIPNSFGEFLTPSIVSFDADGTVYVGKIAKERQVTHPESTISVFKRFMGTSKTYDIEGKEYKPEELSALVLQRLKEDAERYLGEPVDEAVISVPAYFNDLARNATKDAGKLAGVKVDRIINEPSAAALAYQQQRQAEDATILVFDFGGGTLDVSLVDCFDNVVEILAVSGDNRLGGSDFDRAIAEAFYKDNNIEKEQLSSEERAIVLEKAMLAKIGLTKSNSVIMQVNLKGNCYDMTLDNSRLIEISSFLFGRMSVPVKRVLSDAQMSQDNITAVVLVGGSCKMPIVQKYIEHIFDEKDILVLNPDHMIALGIGAYVGIKERCEDIKDMLLTDICPFSLGTGVNNPAEPDKDLMKIIIERNTALPASREAVFHTISDYQTKVVIEVYQGEEFYAADNLLLGEFEISVLPRPKGEEKVRLRYTYDINGILVVDAMVLSTGEEKQLVLHNEKIRMTEEEVREKLLELEKLKIHPREKEENKLMIERAARLYKETTGNIREEIGRRAGYFEYLIEKQDEFRIKRFNRTFMAYLDYVEQYFAQINAAFDEVSDFKEWYLSEKLLAEETEEWQEDEETYEYWKSQKYTS